MSLIGLIGLLVAFAACLVSVGCLGVAHLKNAAAKKVSAASDVAVRHAEAADAFSWGGRLAACVAALALTVCCGVLVWCFMTGDITLDYVVRNRSDTTGDLSWLYKLAGLWAGRAGSLLFWGWLIAVFAAVVVFATRKGAREVDHGAVAVIELVLAAFVGVLLFSEDNMPFTLLDAQYVNDDGSLAGVAQLWGMNTLLEHWAMAIHPPTLFIGYAGMTVPFAYAIAALVANDDSDLWVRRSTPYLIFSWLLLGAGIGLGAVWAYVVLGWGGYWGWDPVENASLLPWLVGVALIHSFTIYRQRGAFKRWSVICACLAFSFVVLGTFITRSGLVESVHAFEGDPVSLVLFAALIVLSFAGGVLGLLVRRKSFGAAGGGEAVGASASGAEAADASAAAGTASASASTNASASASTNTNASTSAPASASNDDIDSLASREAAYYVNNLIMIAAAVLLAYMTMASAFPEWLPFGGQSLSAGTYNAIARPLGIVYCALMAVCPLLGWRRTQGKAFWRNARVPLIGAIVAFALLMAYFVTYLLPSYNAILAGGGSGAEGLLEQGAPAYYQGLTVVGFLVASLLFFNALFMVVKALRAPGALRERLPRIGGGLAHTAMAVILVGLIGSSMYVTETTDYLAYDEETDQVTETLQIQDFELVYTGNTIEVAENNDDILYTLNFDVYRSGQAVGSVAPSVQVVQSTQQQKLVASVISFPLEDLFVVYRGVNTDGDFSMDVRVNPLITFVWIGFALLMVGAALALFGRRKARVEPGNTP